MLLIDASEADFVLMYWKLSPLLHWFAVYVPSV
jgi:hypothetical protein